jgi:hypothetical protein
MSRRRISGTITAASCAKTRFRGGAKTLVAAYGEFICPLPIPALTPALLLLALALTFGKGLWQPSAPAPDDESFMEVLPIAEQLEFFSDMELLDNLDLLETLGGHGNGTA